MRSLLLASFIATLAGPPALAQATVAPPASPHVTPAYGTDPEHRHQAYATASYGISCPRDRVVWVNTRSGVYHSESERWFGRTRQGQYECEKQALAEGDRETLNGQ